MTMPRRYAIQFTYSDGGPLYAGMADGAFGWAPTLETALIYDEREVAERVLANAYGPAMRDIGEVIELKGER